MKWLGAAVMFVTVAGFARPAAAQDTPMAEISGGYNWLAAKQADDDEWEKFSKGFYVDLAGNVSDTLSIVGQFTGNYKTIEDPLGFDPDFDLKVHTFMGGLRGSSPGRVRGFGQFLVGGAQLKASDDFDEADETDFAIQLGGGVNVMGAGGVGFRVGVDYLRIFAKEDGLILGGEDVNGFRFNVGVTIGLGAR